MLATEDLLVFYENALAVNNVTLTVRAGEIVGVFGPNGAGKSTLLYAITGILRERAVRQERRGGERITVLGRITLHGQDLDRLPPWARVARGLVLCPERRRVFPESSVMENLRLGAYRRRDRWDGETLNTVWEIFPDLYNLKTRLAGFLSGGEQQMLAIARALMAQPELLLVDEPLLGLSPTAQAAVIDALGRIGATGVTLVIAEQHARAVLPLVTSGYVIESGAIAVTGTGRELMANPHVRAAYFGT